MSPGQTQTRNRGGHTLIELMLALVLFAIGATALAGGMRNAVRSVDAARAWSTAAFSAESRLEQLRFGCAPAPGAASIGPVNERWSVGSSAGPMLPSVEILDSLTIKMSAKIASRVVHSIVRCVP